jgi:hypothetical protein
MDVKELLRQAADDLPVDHRIPPEVATRARRRRTRNGMLAGVVGVALLVGVGFGVRGAIGFFAPDARPVDTPPAEWRGIWPQNSRAEAETAQAAADEGDQSFTWQLQGEEVARRYAQEVLAFPEAFVLDYPAEGPDEAGPLTAVVSDCDERVGVSVCKGARRAEVTIERLLRPDATGIWFVMASEELGSGHAVDEAEVRTFIDRFMEVRMGRSEEAPTFLTDEARTQFRRGEAGLKLFGYMATWELVDISLSAPYPRVYEVRLTWYEQSYEGHDGETFNEMLTVGPHPDTDDPNALAVYTATRLDPGPTGAKARAQAFVNEFMWARLDGPNRTSPMTAHQAEWYLSPEGKAVYDTTDIHANDLYLYGYPHGDPTFGWIAFGITQIERGGKENSFAVAVHLERYYPNGGEPPAPFTEILIVGPGQDLEGNDREFVVLSAEWVDV